MCFKQSRCFPEFHASCVFFSSFFCFSGVLFRPFSSILLQLVLLQHRRPPCPKDTKKKKNRTEAQSRQTRKDQKKKSRHIVKSRMAPEFVLIFETKWYILWYQYFPRKMVPSKAVFLDNSSCVAPPQKHVRKDARLSSGRVRGTLSAFFLTTHEHSWW